MADLLFFGFLAAAAAAMLNKNLPIHSLQLSLRVLLVRLAAAIAIGQGFCYIPVILTLAPHAVMWLGHVQT